MSLCFARCLPAKYAEIVWGCSFPFQVPFTNSLFAIKIAPGCNQLIPNGSAQSAGYCGRRRIPRIRNDFNRCDLKLSRQDLSKAGERCGQRFQELILVQFSLTRKGVSTDFQSRTRASRFRIDRFQAGARKLGSQRLADALDIPRGLAQAQAPFPENTLRSVARTSR